VSDKVRKWSRRQWHAIRWFASDKYVRTPETETALALDIGINPRTLYRWKQKPEFWEEVKELSREQFKQDLSQYYSALSREAIKGSYQHLQLAMTMAGELEQQSMDGTITIRIKYDDSHADPAPAALGTGNGHRPGVEA
jgi:hypothetical protein